MAGTKWAPFGNHDLITRHMTSSLRDGDFKGYIFGRTIYRPSLTVIAYILAKLWGDGTISPPPRPQKTKKKPGLESI